MVYRIAIIIAIVFSVAVIFLAMNVFAATPNSGLFIQPARQEQKVSPGNFSKQSIKIADYTDKPMTVTLSVKKFQVASYSYKYSFTNDDDNWIKFSQNQLQLNPGQAVTVDYVVNAPKNAPPGGHYFAIFASSTATGQGISHTGQVVSLLFLTVGGKIVQSGNIQNGNVPFLNMGTEITYKFDAEATGNIYYAADFYGQLESIFGKTQQYKTTHVLMPGAKRNVSGTVPAPLIPWLYKITYGYKNGDSDVTSKSEYILFVPPWFVVLLVILVFGAVDLWRKKRRSGTVPA